MQGEGILQFGDGANAVQQTRRSRVILSVVSSRDLDLFGVLSMALPQPLRVSITPPELELMASEHLVEIVPLIAMEKTAFISVERTPASS